MARVLVVDADAESASRLAAILAENQLRSLPAPDLERAAEFIKNASFDVAIVDPGKVSDRDVLARMFLAFDDVPVIVATNDGPTASAAVQAGAMELVDKPYEATQIEFIVGKVLATARDDPPDSTPDDAVPIASSRAMLQVLDIVRRIASGSATVLIRGESGTGKEVIARAIHAGGSRRQGPFIKVHCSSLPDSLMESELFGYERGAFTGASARKPGRVELAAGGTLFLDEIGDVNAATQVKLLRLLQDRSYERLGGTATLTADVRFIAATHRDLEGMSRTGAFREDLFYRLNVVPLWLPPLRARRDDIRALALHFVRLYGDRHGKAQIRLSEAALTALHAERWPGNVRQLQNLVERLVVLSETDVIDGDIVAAELGPPARFSTQSVHLAAPATFTPGAQAPSAITPLDEALRDAERQAIERALRHAHGNRTLAARLLGVSRASFYLKLEEHGLSRKER